MIYNGIREYYENYPVEIVFDEEQKRWCIVAYNEGHCNATSVDLFDVLDI